MVQIAFGFRTLLMSSWFHAQATFGIHVKQLLDGHFFKIAHMHFEANTVFLSKSEKHEPQTRTRLSVRTLTVQIYKAVQE